MTFVTEGRKKRKEGRGEREGGKKRRRPIGRSTNLNFSDRPPLLSIPS
ncbi:MAG: hypothetical protein ABI180_09420 [Microcoleus sp.]